MDQELSLAVERDALLQEDSIIFALIKQWPTLPPPKLPVAGPFWKWFGTSSTAEKSNSHPEGNNQKNSEQKIS
uniref:Uncharacterized protein n=1 Tax=Oryza rufipogon TaxID=4529 RepID=A0A0E0NNM1_ORYRU